MPNTNANTGQSALSLKASSRLYQLVDTFEAAWQAGKRPAINDFLPADVSLRQSVLIKLVHIDLEYRLRAGEKARVETYLERYPEIVSHAATVIELVGWEFALRRRDEVDLSPEEYLRRFPQFAGELSQHLFMPESSEIGPSSPTHGADVSHAVRTGSLDVDTTAVPERYASQTHSSGTPRQVGAYEILTELAVGGMGIVYKARHKGDDAIVALKMMRPEIAGNPEQAQRFHREILAAARLHHDHIVPILDVGWHEGKPFYVMPFCAGNLGSLRKQPTTDIRTVVAVMEKVARGVQHAHEQHVLHRDLKPANILLDERCEPAVADFGLAKLHDTDLELTQPGTVMGTLPYMSPEQAAGRTRDLGPATDVWALGVMLYELLAGQRPFVDGDANDLREKIQAAKVTPLRKVRPDIPWELEAIVARCLNKKANRRYLSAAALADDLRRWQRGDKIAKPWPSNLTAAALAAVAVLAVGLAAVAFALRRDPNNNLPPQPPVHQEPTQVLIGATGPPTKGRLLGGDKETIIVGKPGELFSLETKTFALWELAAKPPAEFYRFEAEVRFDNSDDGDAGIFVGHRVVAAQHFCWKLGFTENGRAPGAVNLDLRRFSPPFGISSLALTAPFTSFVPSSPPDNPPTFHHLKIDVQKDRIAVFWDGTAFGDVKKSQFDGAFPDRFFEIRLAETEFCPTSSVGAYVHAGKASFRNCVLKSDAVIK